MAAIFGPGGPIILPWTVRGDHFRGGTVHGVTDLLTPVLVICSSMWGEDLLTPVLVICSREGGEDLLTPVLVICSSMWGEDQC